MSGEFSLISHQSHADASSSGSGLHDARVPDRTGGGGGRDHSVRLCKSRLRNARARQVPPLAGFVTAAGDGGWVGPSQPHCSGHLCPQLERGVASRDYSDDSSAGRFPHPGRADDRVQVELVDLDRVPGQFERQPGRIAVEQQGSKTELTGLVEKVRRRGRVAARKQNCVARVTWTSL